MKPKIVLKLEIPMEGESVTLSDTRADVEEKIKNLVDELNKDLTKSNIFGIIKDWTVEIKNTADPRQLELDFGGEFV